MFLLRAVTECAVLTPNNLQLPGHCKKLGGSDASWKTLSERGSTMLQLPENRACRSPPGGFTLEAAALLGLIQPYLLSVTSWGNWCGVALGLLTPVHSFLAMLFGLDPTSCAARLHRPSRDAVSANRAGGSRPPIV